MTFPFLGFKQYINIFMLCTQFSIYGQTEAIYKSQMTIPKGYYVLTHIQGVGASRLVENNNTRPQILNFITDFTIARCHLFQLSLKVLCIGYRSIT